MDGLEWAHMETCLVRARQAREGRDLWRAVGPLLRQLREADVPWRLITQRTGIPQATGHRMIARSRLSSSSTSGNSSSEAGS